MRSARRLLFHTPYNDDETSSTTDADEDTNNHHTTINKQNDEISPILPPKTTSDLIDAGRHDQCRDGCVSVDLWS